MTRQPKFDLLIEQADAPVRDRVTKFGGRPVWLEDPAWPLVPATGEPMEFVAQVRLDPQIFGNPGEAMAYLFVADAVEAEDTWDPYGGESAVVLQPGDPSLVRTSAQIEGPSLHHLFDEWGGADPVAPELCEFTVIEVPGSDPASVDEETADRWAADPWLEYVERSGGALGTPRGIKVGGEPYFFRDWPEAFPPDQWRLLLQLDGDLPFFLNLGMDGIGYVLVRNDLRCGVFFWERPG